LSGFVGHGEGSIGLIGVEDKGERRGGEGCGSELGSC
jgi:hypothetical protein